MNDPHVVSLKYRFVKEPDVDYSNPPPIDHEIWSFRLRLDEQGLIVTMLDHYPSAESAREIVDPWLRAWEIDQALSLGKTELRFEYEGVEIIDRSPPVLGQGQVVVSGAVAFISVGTVLVNATVTQGKYPAFPKRFKLTPDLETLWHRYRGFEQGREPLTSMGYFCLTLVEQSAGGRKHAANTYKISREILNKLGHLTSALGDVGTARKVGTQGLSRPLTAAEREWIKGAVKLLARRLGEWAFDPSGALPKLTLADLP